MLTAVALSMCGATAAVAIAVAEENSDASPTEVWMGDELVVTYSAFTTEGTVYVRVDHEEDWHTYAMDNVLRAQERSGKEVPETELPTRITMDGVDVDSGWLQTEPLDLSQPELRWYTWGFEGRSWFARGLGDSAAPSSVLINGQACTAELCAMVEDLAVAVSDATLADRPDLASLVVVRTASSVSTSQDDFVDARGRRFDDVELFGSIFHRTLDADCDGEIPFEEFVAAVAMSPDRPRQLNWLMNFDANEDGIVVASEIAEGLRRNTRYQVDRAMGVDADGDGELTRREHALSIASRGAEPEAGSDFTQQQNYWFDRLDQNGDGKILREEVVADYSRNYTSLYWGYLVSHRLERADANGDGWLEKNELVNAVTRASPRQPERLELGADLMAWFDRFSAKHETLERAVSLTGFYGQLQQNSRQNVEWKLEVEAPLRPLLVPCGVG